MSTIYDLEKFTILRDDVRSFLARNSEIIYAGGSDDMAAFEELQKRISVKILLLDIDLVLIALKGAPGYLRCILI